ncbi:MAG: ABC transporter substrate-binding protein [Planctomycetota bacterium]
MSRVLPVLLGVLVLATGVGLGYQVLQGVGGGGTGAPSDPTAVGDGPPAAPDVVPQGHLYCGVTEEPGDFNPFTTRSAVVRRYVCGFTHETLLDTDPRTGELRGALAREWQVDPDGMGMVVTLRDGVRFADGAPMTVEDVLFTFEVARSEGVSLGTLAEGMHLVASAEVVAGEPARLHLRFADRHFDAVGTVGRSWVVVQRRWFLQAIRDQAQRTAVAAPSPRDPGFGALLAQVTRSPGPGTGPYRFADETEPQPSWRPARDLTLFRNGLHWRRAAEPGCWNFGGVRLLFVADQAARFAALHQRAIDWYGGSDLDALLADDARLQEHYRHVVYDLPQPGIYLVQWNTRRAGLRDPAVRRALGMLFDRQAICDRVFGGNARPVAAFADPRTDAYPQDLQPLPFDPGAARRLLRDAGFGVEDGPRLSLELLVPVELPVFRQIAELAADAARTIGVDLRVQVLPYRTVMDRRSMKDEWDATLMLYWLSTPDPHDVFHSEGARNPTGWHDERANDLLDQQRAELDPERRARLLREFHHLAFEAQPVSTLVLPRAELLLDRHLQNAEVGPLGLWPERFWMPPRFQRPGP